MTTFARQISVIVPVYNSASSVATVVGRVSAVLEIYCESFELILVNDGSTDSSWHAVERAVLGSNHVLGVNLARNSGQHAALLCGIRLAKFPVCVTLDDDLQFQPEDIPVLVDRLSESVDLVYGCPRKQKQDLWRKAGSQTIRSILKMLVGGNLALHASPFRAFKTRIREAFKDAACDATLIDVLISWGTTRYAAVTVEHVERSVGRSTYSFSKLVFTALNMVTGFTTIPLRIATFNGLACVMMGLLLLVYVFYQIVKNGGSVPGFPFIASVTIIFSGAQLLALGIIGEYLGRMFNRTLNRPAYFAEDIISSTAPDKLPSLEENALTFDMSVPENVEITDVGRQLTYKS